MPDTVANAFFQEQRSFVEVKQELLVKYFEAWCANRMATRPAGDGEPFVFVDLNTAAGQDQQAQQHMPISVLQNLIRSTLKKQGLHEMLRFYLDDPVKSELGRMMQELEQLTAYAELSVKPALLNQAENRASLGELLDCGYPALFFLDPFSYGYAQDMLLHACNTWRSDLFLLLNPDSIQRAFTGKKVSQPLTELFGAQLPLIRAFCRKEKHNGRLQEYILQHLQSLLREKGFYILLFRINQPGTDSASHYLLFSSPDVAAYNIFKQMVLPYSEYQPDGVPLFIANQGPQHQLSLFEHRPAYAVSLLIEELSATPAQWKFKSVEKIYEMHSPNTPYILENYLTAFEHLRDQGKVVLLNGKTLQTIRKATYTSVVKYIG